MSVAGCSVLVVGGYGGFGRRLVELLEGMELDQIFVAGRSLDRAREFCSDRGGKVSPVALDRSQSCSAQLRELAPNVVIDAAGPFQLYGNEPFALAETCIELGINYLDLADGRDFVCGIRRCDEAARQNGVFVLSGASSVPALSGAAIRALVRDSTIVEHIDIGISPAGGSFMGPNVVRAILSYVGREVAVREESRWQQRHCWTDLRSRQLGIAGHASLNRRRFSLCDVPDLALWPEIYPAVRSVRFAAALEPALNHFGMVALAWLVRLGLLRRAVFLAPVLDRVARWMPAGQRRGGMYVQVDGAFGVADWTLIAEGDHGPYIPTMASAAVVSQVLDGRSPAAGARACTHELELADFEPLFARFDIETRIRRPAAEESGVQR